MITAKLVDRKGSIEGGTYKAISIEVDGKKFGGRPGLVLRVPEYQYKDEDGNKDAVEDILEEIVNIINDTWR